MTIRRYLFKMWPRSTRLAVPGLRFVRTVASVSLLVLCGLQAQAQTRDIVLFGDVSLKRALDDANNLFLFENAMVVAASYGASSALAKQIESRATADVFISAHPDSMNYLAERRLIKPNSRWNFLGNKLVLIANADSASRQPIGQDFPLAQALGNGRLAMPDPAAFAAGKYGKAALESLGVWSSVADKVV